MNKMLNFDENSFPYWAQLDPEWEYLGSFMYKNHLNTGRCYDLYYRNSVIGQHLLARYGNRSLDCHMVALYPGFKNPFPPLEEAYKLCKKKFTDEKLK